MNTAGLHFCLSITGSLNTHIHMSPPHGHHHVASIRWFCSSEVSVAELFSCLPAERSVFLSATLPLPHYCHKHLCVNACVWVCVSWLSGCALRPAGLEQDQKTILYDDMVSRRDLGWNHSRAGSKKIQQFISGHHSNEFNVSFNSNATQFFSRSRLTLRATKIKKNWNTQINSITPMSFYWTRHSCLRHLAFTSQLTEQTETETFLQQELS